MDDIPGKDDPLKWLRAGPVILFVLALPTAVVGALLFTVLVLVDSVVGLPRVTFGVVTAAGVPADLVLPLLVAAVLGVVISMGLLALTGFTRNGTDELTTWDDSFR